MKAQKGMFKIIRDSQLCRNIDNCESKVCLEYLPGLKDGDIKIAAWALIYNEKVISGAIDKCPKKAVQLGKIK